MALRFHHEHAPMATKLVQLNPGLTDEDIEENVRKLFTWKRIENIEDYLAMITTQYHSYYEQNPASGPITEHYLYYDCWNSEQPVIGEEHPDEANDPRGVNDASKYMTLVSGFWSIKSKYDSTKYDQWFQNSLKINMPYIIFTDEDNLARIAQHRLGLPTVFIKRELSQFSLADRYNATWTHPRDVPSKELALIWLEKVKLLSIAAQYTVKPFLMWIDAGICTFREKKPPPMEFSSDVLLSLPHNRISYCYTPESYHSFAGTTFIVPRQLVSLLEYLFYQEFEVAARDTADWHCGSDQFLFTRLKQEYPELFHIMCYDYGEISFLWGQAATRQSALTEELS